MAKRGSDFSFTSWLQPGDANAQQVQETVSTVFLGGAQVANDMKSMALMTWSEKVFSQEVRLQQGNR